MTNLVPQVIKPAAAHRTELLHERITSAHHRHRLYFSISTVLVEVMLILHVEIVMIHVTVAVGLFGKEVIEILLGSAE